jgi:hypothetical protein
MLKSKENINIINNIYDIYNIPIGSKVQFQNNGNICTIIGYNSDKSLVMYIMQNDTTIFENMKFEYTVNILNILDISFNKLTI